MGRPSNKCFAGDASTFTEISIFLGSFLGDFLGPVLGELKEKVIEPLDPFIGKVMASVR